MESKTTLQDHLHDLDSLVIALIAGDKRLYALIPSQHNLYFLPGEFTNAEDVHKKRGNDKGNVEESYLAKSGRYAVCDLESVIRALENISDWQSNPDSLGRVRPPTKVAPKSLMTDENATGSLVEKEWDGYLGEYRYNFLRIPFNRLLVEQVDALPNNAVERPKKKKDEIARLIEIYLSEYEKKGDQPEINDLWGFLEQQDRVDVHQDGYLLYPIYDGAETKRLTKKQLSGRLANAMKNR